ncbi:PTR2 family proton/oligopeptide symporter [Chloropicon primus]|uniref:PTR2 family proton/oligopeptide symporter n=1 Tax=Chloropicon primus TaxID=1764295 RepID=A0A5B8MXG9_9CHLO|nr:PTR2 family proton/oligopeptide symporter [Chloropicon primus]|eukprot:QDZ24170.1 PTR2 family proton/oligopeptide symporter [Chloropicon primus]
MTDSIIRADAMLSARRPGVTASSLRTGLESSLRSVYSMGHSALASVAEFPDEELTPFTLACFLVIAVELGERATYYTTKLLYPSFATQMLGMSSSELNILMNFNDFWNYGNPLLGAYLADAFLGRFKAICLGAPIYVLGLSLLVLSSTPLAFGDFPYLEGGWAKIGFWMSITVMGVGCGFIKPCVSVFAAEQLKDENGNDASPRTLEKLYLWWYLAINIGSFVGPVVAPLLSGGTEAGLPNLLPGYEKFQCSGNATLIPACEGYCPGGCTTTPPTPEQFSECCNGPRVALNYWLVWGCWSLPMLLLAFLTFFLGAWRPGYVISPPQGSYLGDFFKALWGAVRCLDNKKPSDGKGMRCFERLKGIPGMPSDRLLDEFRMMLITSSIFLPFSLFWFANSQMYSWGYNQCNPALKISGWVDCNQIQIMNSLAILVTIPIFDFGLYPLLAKFRVRLTHIHKISAGMVIMGCCLLIMGGLQSYINKQGYYSGPSSTSYVYYDPKNYKEHQASVYWQVPIFWLSGVAEVVGNIATLELAYVGSPPSMKSLVMAFGLMTSCGGAIIGFIVNPFYTSSRSIYFQYVTGAITVLMGPTIWFFWRNLRTGRDLMPELFEENLKAVIRTGSMGSLVGQGGGSLMEFRGSLKTSMDGKPGGYEMGSKNAMEALTSLQGSLKKSIQEEGEEEGEE